MSKSPHHVCILWTVKLFHLDYDLTLINLDSVARLVHSSPEGMCLKAQGSINSVNMLKQPLCVYIVPRIFKRANELNCRALAICDSLCSFLKARMRANGWRCMVRPYKRQECSRSLTLHTAVDFFNHLNMLYGTVTEFCTPEEVYLSTPELRYSGPDPLSSVLSCQQVPDMSICGRMACVINDRQSWLLQSMSMPS